VFTGCAAFCFAKGLDEHNDYVYAPQWLISGLGAQKAAAQDDYAGPVPGNQVKLNRFHHGGWHICVGALFHCVLHATELKDSGKDGSGGKKQL
jgi:hypothetical protein